MYKPHTLRLHNQYSNYSQNKGVIIIHYLFSSPSFIEAWPGDGLGQWGRMGGERETCGRQHTHTALEQRQSRADCYIARVCGVCEERCGLWGVEEGWSTHGPHTEQKGICTTRNSEYRIGLISYGGNVGIFRIVEDYPEIKIAKLQ